MRGVARKTVLLLGLLALSALVVAPPAFNFSSRVAPPGDPVKTVSSHASSVTSGLLWPKVHVSVIRLSGAGLIGASLAVNSGGQVFASGGYSGIASTDLVEELLPAHKTVGRLLVPTHDAASGFLGSHLYVIGGGQYSSYNTIVQAGNPSTLAGTLAHPLSDASALAYSLGGRPGLLIIGGYDGTVFHRQVLFLSLRRGRVHIQPAFEIPVGLRYTAVCRLGRNVYIVGGKTTTGKSRAIYLWSPSLNKVRRIGLLPAALDKAAAWSVPGYLMVAGGLGSHGHPHSQILAFSLQTKQVRVIGHLPFPLADMGYASTKQAVYLSGGMTSSSLSHLFSGLLVVDTTWFQ